MIGPGRRRVPLLVASLTLTACSDPELLVRVDRAGDVAAPSRLLITVHTSDPPTVTGPHEVALSGGLPASFLVRPGPETRGRLARIHVDGLSDALAPVGSGDARAALPTSGRSDERAVVTLRAECRGLSCAGLAACDPDLGGCDHRCLADGDCAGEIGCTADGGDGPPRCVGGGDGRLGTCTGVAADADDDGASDARCALDPAAGADCDDTDAAVPSDGARCGASRDHDCSGLVDEHETCASACAAAGIASIGLDGAAVIAEGDLGPVQAIGGVRPLAGRLVAAVVAGEDARTLALVAEDGETVDALDGPELRALAWAGPLLAAATDAGLWLVDVDAAGTLTPLGEPLAVPPGASAGLTAVLVAEETVWVSGPGVGLGAVDVSAPSAPRFAGAVEGPSARALARGVGTVVAATERDDDGATIRVYGAPATSAPTAPTAVRWIPATGEPAIDDDLVTVDDVRVARAGAAGGRTFVLVASHGPASEGHAVRLFEQTGAPQLEERVRISTPEPAGMFLDRGVLVYGTRSGLVRALVRSPSDPSLLRGAGFDVSTPAPTDCDGPATALWATSRVGTEQPLAVLAQCGALKWVRFLCE